MTGSTTAGIARSKTNQESAKDGKDPAAKMGQLCKAEDIRGQQAGKIQHTLVVKQDPCRRVDGYLTAVGQKIGRDKPAGDDTSS